MDDLSYLFVQSLLLIFCIPPSSEDTSFQVWSFPQQLYEWRVKGQTCCSLTCSYLLSWSRLQLNGFLSHTFEFPTGVCRFFEGICWVFPLKLQLLEALARLREAFRPLRRDSSELVSILPYQQMVLSSLGKDWKGFFWGLPCDYS